MYFQLSQMARDFLAMQPTTVPLERAWSICRFIYRHERYGLQVGTLEERFCLHFHTLQNSMPFDPTYQDPFKGPSDASGYSKKELNASLSYSSLLGSSNHLRIFNIASMPIEEPVIVASQVARPINLEEEDDKEEEDDYVS